MMSVEDILGSNFMEQTDIAWISLTTRYDERWLPLGPGELDRLPDSVRSVDVAAPYRPVVKVNWLKEGF